MNKDQFARLARHRKVQQTLADQAAAVAAVPALARLATTYGQQLALLGDAARRNAVSSEGATLAKGATGKALVARLVKVANALYLHYKADQNLADAAKMHRVPSDYINMTDLTLATEAADLRQRAADQQPALADYNLTAADVAAMAADVASFDHLLTAPQLAIDAEKIKGATATATLSALNRFLSDDLRAGIELLKDSHPAAYQALREASQVDDAAFHLSKAKRATKAAQKAAAAAKPTDTPAPDPAG